MTLEQATVVNGVTPVDATWGNGIIESLAMRTPFPVRLTLEAGVPVSTTDQTAKTVLRTAWTGTGGDRVHLLDGSTFKPYRIDSLPTLDLSGLAASTIYDIFMYPVAGVPTLERVAWASLTARAQAITDEQGYKVKTSDGKRYVGTILSDAAGGAATDALSRRGVWNYYNRQYRTIRTYNTASSWTYSSTIREYNNGVGQVRGEFVLGLASYPSGNEMGHAVSGTFVGSVAWAIDSTSSANGKQIFFGNGFQTIFYTSSYSRRDSALAIGYHYFTQVESVTSGTMTNNGNNALLSAYLFMEM